MNHSVTAPRLLFCAKTTHLQYLTMLLVDLVNGGKFSFNYTVGYNHIMLQSVQPFLFSLGDRFGKSDFIFD